MREMCADEAILQLLSTYDNLKYKTFISHFMNNFEDFITVGKSLGVCMIFALGRGWIK